MPAYKSAFIFGNSPVYQQDGGAIVEDDTATIPAVALVIGDTIDMLRVSGGTRLQFLAKQNTALDSGATLTYSLGFRPADSGGVLVANASFFGVGFTDLRAAVPGSAKTQYAFPPTDFNEDIIIFATVTAAATGSPGVGTVTTFMTGKARGVK